MSAVATTPKAWDWNRFAGSPEALKWNRRDLPFLDVVLKYVPGRTAVVQAGGHLGLWPKKLAESFATVYTFEPAADLFAAMQKNAPEPNIVKFQAALGDQRELVGLSRVRRDGKTNIHEGITHVSGSGVIPTLRVDDLGLEVCDLLMLDVEGWELFALRGAVETIRRCRPVLVVEVNKNLGYVGLTPADVAQFLGDLRYGVVQRHQSDEVYLPIERVDGAL